MSHQEKDRFDVMLELQKEIQQGQESIKKDISQISRAIYGDEANKVLGLIDRQIKDEEDLISLKDSRNKFYWVAGGVILAFEVLILAFKSFFSN